MIAVMGPKPTFVSPGAPPLQRKKFTYRPKYDVGFLGGKVRLRAIRDLADIKKVSHCAVADRISRIGDYRGFMTIFLKEGSIFCQFSGVRIIFNREP